MAFVPLNVTPGGNVPVTLRLVGEFVPHPEKLIEVPPVAA
jgi:hypothetical protein